MSHHLSIPRILSLVAVISATSLACDAQDWNQFRGPNGTAVADVANTPVTISKANTVWKTAIPGVGWSSPVVADGRIWITTAETTAATKEQIKEKTRGVQFAQIKTVAASVSLRALSIDAQSGEIIHNLLLSKVDDPDLINPLNSYASPTPVIVGERVICHFGNYGTWCLNNRSGDQIWQKAIKVDHSVGPGSSPVVVDNIVLLVCDGIDQQFVAGLDLNTGHREWTTKRPQMRASNGEYKKAYSTPLVIRIAGKTQAVIPGAQWICAYEPATGKEIWRADAGNGFSTTPMPVHESGLVICSTGFMTGELVAIDPQGTGDLSNKIRWRAKKGGSTMPTAVGKDGRLYSISDDGILTILDARSGDVSQRLRVGGKFASSPLLVANKLYVGNQDGELSVFRIDPSGGEPTRLATNELDGAIMASPALIGSDLIVRTSKSLMRVQPN